MHKIKFYPVGNGDSSQIVLKNGKRILFDYRHLKSSEDDKGPEINLERILREELKEDSRDYFDVVAFTHGDKDHIENSTELFWFEYKKEFQGEDRIKINELWVPAAIITEDMTNDTLSTEIAFWRQEARHRLREGANIKVFSRPDKLKDWLEGEGLTIESRSHLIVDAGDIVDTFSLEDDGIEFFCHSPFVKHVNNSDDLRNGAALIFNVRLKSGLQTYDYFCVGDSDCSVLEDIVSISEAKGNADRLEWDLYSIPHHCSHHALNAEKGDRVTVPVEGVNKLLKKGREGSYMLCSSDEIKATTEAYRQKMPPHIQAKKTYDAKLKEVDGCRFVVTMEESLISNPQPTVFKFENHGIYLGAMAATSGISYVTSQRTPRAG